MTKLRLVAVMRLSSKAQIRGHGKERQEEDEIKDYVDELDACITDTWFVAERATIFDRPHFEALLTQGISMRRQGTIDGLILGSVDRLSRDPFDGGAVCRDALRAGLRLFFAEDRLDAFREEDQVNIISHLVASRKYAQRLKAQTMPARKARARVGKIPNGQVRWPFDYDSSSGKASPNPERARWVQKWYQELRNGGSLGSIKKTMEQAKIPAPKGGTTWSRSTIRRILSDPAIKGDFTYGFERMEAREYWEPSRRVPSEPVLIYSDKTDAILEVEEWDYVQMVLGRNKEYSRRNTQYDYSPLKGLVICPCGRKVGAYTHRKSGIGYFRCGTCRNGDVSTQKLWDSVRDWLESCISSYNVFAALVSNGMEAPDSIGQIEKQVAEDVAEIEVINESITRAIRMGVRLSSYEDRFESIIQELEVRLAQVQASLAVRQNVLNDRKEREAAVLTLESTINAFRARLPSVTDSEWRQLLLDLGLTAVIKPRSKADIMVSVRLSTLINQRIEQPVAQTGQILGGVMYLHS